MLCEQTQRTSPGQWVRVVGGWTGAQIVRDHAGHPTEVLLATPAPFILYGVLGRLPVLDPDQQVSCTRHFLRELNRFGITSAIDGVGGSQQFPDNYAAVMQLARSGDLSVWGLLSGDDNVRGGPAGSGVTGS